MDAIESDQESDLDLWDDPGFNEQYVVASLPIGARGTVANLSQSPIVPGILNDDCWRHILDYVSLEDIEWSKSISQEWQAMVHRYMEGVRLRIETISNVWDVDEQIRRRKCRVLVLRDDPVSFSAALDRWGASVRELVYDAKAATHAELRDLGEMCPNLEDITLVRLRWHAPSCDWAANFRNLKRVCFENSQMVDSCIREFLKNNTIEELVIRMSESFSGNFFVAEEENADLRKLNTLVLSNCLDLKLSNLQTAVESGNLADVTKLELRYCKRNLPLRLGLLLDKMPRLEHLSVDCDADLLDEDVVGAATRLARLEHLGWHNGTVFSGEKLDDVRKDMTGAEVSNGRTVMDYLNEDCWRAILDYVPVHDIILSEPVSRRWQQMVLIYLRSQRINIEMEGTCLNLIAPPAPANVRTVTLRLTGPIGATGLMGLPGTSKSFRLWFQKLSSAVVATWCNSKRMFKAIRHCPNLESLTLVGIEDTLIVKQNENFTRLRQLTFVQCMLSDDCINNFTKKNPVLEEFAIYANFDMHGSYLSKMKSSCLKTLIFCECTGLMSEFLISAVNHLRGLTKLILHKVPRAIYDKVHLLLNNMPHLEYFAIHIPFNGMTEILNEKNLEYIESVCRLRSLENLALAYDASDDDIDAVTKHCTKLQGLEIVQCYAITGRGLAAICRNAGARLEMLDVSQCDLQDDDVVAVIQQCPKLTSLNLQVCGCLSGDLLPRIAAARRELGARSLLRLHVGHTYMWHHFDESKEKYKEELIIQY